MSFDFDNAFIKAWAKRDFDDGYFNEWKDTGNVLERIPFFIDIAFVSDFDF